MVDTIDVMLLRVMAERNSITLGRQRLASPPVLTHADAHA